MVILFSVLVLVITACILGVSNYLELMVMETLKPKAGGFVAVVASLLIFVGFVFITFFATMSLADGVLHPYAYAGMLILGYIVGIGVSKSLWRKTAG